jgi:hypothetical protein
MALVSVILVCRNPGPRVRAAVASTRPQDRSPVQLVAPATAENLLRALRSL